LRKQKSNASQIQSLKPQQMTFNFSLGLQFTTAADNDKCFWKGNWTRILRLTTCYAETLPPPLSYANWNPTPTLQCSWCSCCCACSVYSLCHSHIKSQYSLHTVALHRSFV